jgi:uncharacterized membrane protein (DUF4010 family)
MDFLQAPELRPALVFFSSFAIGLLVGLERERRPEAKAGVRTFALITAFGTLSALLAQKLALPWLVPAGLLAVAATLIAAYIAEPVAAPDSGTTTVIAALMCFSLGAAMWLDHLELAVALGIVITVLLYFKTSLEGFSQKLTATDVGVTLQFAVLTLVILPLLPDRGFGPYAALNPRNIWLMVVLIEGVGLAGYLSWRLLGARGGVVVTGLLGGLVSSTATTVVYARDTREAPHRASANALIIVLASSVVFVRMMVLTSVVAPVLLAPLAAVAVTALLVALPYALYGLRAQYAVEPGVLPDFANPTRLSVAVTFGLIYGVVLLGVSWLSDVAGSRGLYLFAFVSGLTDVDAIALSSMRLHLEGHADADSAVSAIAIALIANLVLKWATAWIIGGGALARRLALPLGSMALAVAAARVLTLLA